ncbi:hypothetical protein [Peribacillus deserti]|uniref:Lipoprotein n=1 Tax=Peribacillus deserti TaxID=673318 RepID=A0A2N5M3M9_9BACI|nr:hypothetical protein [Peribacillus deserti]PLT28942.1 hypothetical protein CUU66_15740 [Peribacillus deserti]
MLKFSKILLGTGILALSLAGCGTAEQESSAPKKETAEHKDHNAGKPSQDTKKNPATEPASSEKQNTMRVMEQNLQYKMNGADKQETAFLKNSDNQHFSMYVLPGYELSAEEPGKDIVFLKDQDSVYMRIELLSNPVWQEEEEMAKAQLMAVSDKISTPALPNFDVKNAAAFEASNDEENVTVVIIKDTNNPVKLTMFTNKDQDHRSAMLEMAKTILKKPSN